MENTHIAVQTDNFSVGEQYQWLAECDSDGAVVTFTGKVRNHNLGDSVAALTLEHYPGMTEKALTNIVTEARVVSTPKGQCYPPYWYTATGRRNRVCWRHQCSS